MAIGGDGSLYIADFNNGRVRKVASTQAGVIPLNGTLTTIAGGSGPAATEGSTPTAVTFGRISGVAVDPATDEVYFSDFDRHRVWKFARPGGTLVLIAGTEPTATTAISRMRLRLSCTIPRPAPEGDCALYRGFQQRSSAASDNERIATPVGDGGRFDERWFQWRR